MIKPSPNGPDLILLSFGDWTSDMMLLSSKLHMLPKSDPDGETSHEIGIDRLHNLPWGDQAIRALFDVADTLEVCPDRREVIRLGKAVMKASLELEKLLAGRERMARLERKKKSAPIRTTGKVGFQRRT